MQHLVSAEAQRRIALAVILLLVAVTAGASHLPSGRSRYLADHASNPVDWYPWGEEAFAKARRESKPVFLSIGYASCHWCHVMARESFEQSDIAALLNEHYVAILVDREEQPDVDATYIAFVQAMNGNAGWPANLILTPELHPLIGSSYLTHDSFKQLLSNVAEKWAADPKRLSAESAQLVEMVRSMGDTPAPTATVDELFRAISSMFDAKNGGFGSAPRFPQPQLLRFLLRYSLKSPRARKMVTLTLHRMAEGGIRDQLGGGFHRYAVDDWRTPHYEKMLYDQALLASAYLEAWQLTGEPFYREVSEGILDDLLRTFRLPGGGFASGLDADSPAGKELVEGAYYDWSLPELQAALGKSEGSAIGRYYGITSADNEPLSLRASSPPAGLAAAKKKLLAVRGARPAPALDDKVLTGWNALAVSALARAGAAFGNERYLREANDGAAFLRKSMHDEQRVQLLRSWRKGTPGLPAMAEDYADLIAASLDLFESTFESRWLDWAIALQEEADRKLWDETSGRYRSGSSLPEAMTAAAPESDSVVPAPNIQMIQNLWRLAELAGRESWGRRARTLQDLLAPRMGDLPSLASSAPLLGATPKQIVIAGDPSRADTQRMLAEVRKRFIPNSVLILVSGGESQKRLAQRLPYIEAMKPLKGKATAYVCEHAMCKLPTSDLAVLKKLLE